MKKLYFTLLTFLASCMLSFAANTVGHFFLDMSDKNIAADLAVQYLQDNFSINNLSEFKLVRDYTDDLGIRHTNYKQYYAGVEVEDALIMVHSKAGVITSINGCILETSVSPEASVAQLRQKNSNGGELMVVSKPTPNGTEYVLAYKIYDYTQHADVYIDAITGEVFKIVPHIWNISADAYTMYNDWQNIEVALNSDNKYILYDEQRNIQTLNATEADPSPIIEFYNNEEVTEENMKEYSEAAFLQYIANCQEFTYPTSVCSYSTIAEIVITSVTNNNWFTSSDPAFYFEIADNAGEVLYTSTSFSLSNLPYSIDLKEDSIFVEEADEIRIYESSSASIGHTISIADHTEGTYIWDTTTGNTEGSYSLINTVKNVFSPAIQAHWGMQETYDFYLNVFNRKSYDNNGSTIYQFINPKEDDGFSGFANNAMFYNAIAENGEIFFPSMIYGMCESVKSQLRPLVSLDIIGHEFTHAVTAFNGNGGLEYLGESGALSESFSDIMGFSIENYVLGNDDYIIGRWVVLYASNMRSMKDPKQSEDGQDPSPDTYEGEYWIDPSDTSKDSGGAHTNSGVQNKWFYLLNEGGSGTNDKDNAYSVSGIGIEKGRQIAYRNMTTYIIPSATFADARAGSLTAAADLYGKDSDEYQAVANAWYAVGVCEAYDPAAIDDEQADEDNISVYSMDGNIYVKAQEPKNIAIYATDGSTLYHAEQTQEAQFSVPAQGIYLVSAGNEKVKVLVKR